ncbi:DUF732 domain-containing protein [Humibacillus sp. DSM 29435]|uniref:DUF732 domain-containing protein n=1 Tax=Humibacillus sp. DSM 29435 TaxID=1869167 RepID=UPI0011131427|nr:DUF732 domain-containing protein [Humibacillus sp. DSM 29435]
MSLPVTARRSRGGPPWPSTAQHRDGPVVVRRLGFSGFAAAALTALALVGLSGCSSAVNLHDLPPDIAAAKPDITAEQADFVLDANRQGASITAASLDDDLESGTTTCWALKNGGIQLRQLAVDDQNRLLGNSGDALRTKALMAAGIRAFCPDYTDQIAQLKLP